MTPWLRLFTSSMKAGGKDHSRPTSKPTFNVIGFLPCVSGSLSLQIEREKLGYTPLLACSSVMATDVQTDHITPPRPVVCPAIPDTQRVPDILTPEDG